MKWVQPSIIVFLLFGFPLFQCDQTIDWDWLICDHFLVAKSDNDSPLDEAFGSDSKENGLHFFHFHPVHLSVKESFIGIIRLSSRDLSFLETSTKLTLI